MNELEIVTCTIVRDLPVTRLALDGIKKHFNAGKISVITPYSAFSACRQTLGSEIELLDEREFAGGMSLDDLQARTEIEGFPDRAGWYFQQLVKLGYSLHGESEGHYLIWDCDTVPLRPLEFFSPDHRPIYTLAEEKHVPYFDTYERLFGYRPDYQGSFISQHMVIDRKIAREMLSVIESRHPLQPSWSWAVINNLATSNSGSLFSEYETYGNYVKSNNPESIEFRRIPWLRAGASQIGTRQPTPRQLRRLSKSYFFAAFENWQVSSDGGIRSRLQRLLRA